MAKVELKNLTKIYGQNTVVDHINLEIENGTLVSILGPSGCGKTTTLRMIAGFEHPEDGDVLFDGQSVGQVPVNKRNIGMVFQSYALFPHMTVEQNVAYGLEQHGAAKSEIPGRVREALEMVHMEEFSKRKPKQLSGGQQQRVSIGRAIVKNPDILLCDEPTGALDYHTSKEILKLIEDVNIKYGNTVIMVTHNEAIRHMADHVIKLRDGEVRHNEINTDKVSAADLEW